jgi:hypothetical protein
MQAVRKLTSVNRLLADLAGLAVIGQAVAASVSAELQIRIGR